MTREEMVDAEVTLNGIRAKVSGRLTEIALVSQLDSPYLSFHYTWEAVERIIKRDGKFYGQV